VGTRVGRSIACPPPRLRVTISPEVHSIKGGDAELGGKQAASLKSVLWFCLLDGTVVELQKSRTPDRPLRRRRNRCIPRDQCRAGARRRM